MYNPSVLILGLGRIILLSLVFLKGCVLPDISHGASLHHYPLTSVSFALEDIII